MKMNVQCNEVCWGIAKTMLNGMLIISYAYILKREISNLSLYLKFIKKKKPEQTEPKISRRKEVRSHQK